ncbi:MAG: hypothetical protein EON48_06595 [Acetobacteraceae bacterium]|nr:MAG: hypothetical protein EON48_06595 [Acetobacteraceae bacterium]
MALSGVMAAAFASGAMAQAPAPKAPAAKAAAPKAAARPAAARASAAGFPRVAGKPDFSGVWSAMSRANWDIEPHAAQSGLQMRPGPVVPVPGKDVVKMGTLAAIPAGMGVVEGGTLPYKPDARKTQQENKQNWIDRDPEVKCYLPGVPRANYMDLPFQIFQSDKSMLIAYEFAGAVRNVLFTDPGPAPVDSWMGQSVAKWVGDTLEVTVTGQIDRTWFDRAGNWHTADMKVVERWTPMDATHVRYSATITDPEVYTRPWTMNMVLYKHVGEDNRLQQFKCVEFVEELIYGHLRKEPLK